MWTLAIRLVFRPQFPYPLNEQIRLGYINSWVFSNAVILWFWDNFWASEERCTYALVFSVYSSSEVTHPVKPTEPQALELQLFSCWPNATQPPPAVARLPSVRSSLAGWRLMCNSYIGSSFELQGQLRSDLSAPQQAPGLTTDGIYRGSGGMWKFTWCQCVHILLSWAQGA